MGYSFFCPRGNHGRKSPLTAFWIVLFIFLAASSSVRAQSTNTSSADTASSLPSPETTGSLDNQFKTALATFRQAPTLDAKFASARKLAAIRFAQGRLVSAQWWLRRAANFAPTTQDADRNRSDFLNIRNLAGYRLSLAFSISPSSNINNGVEDQIFQLGNIILVFPTSALALSGLEYTAQGDFEFRLSEGPKQKTTGDISFFGRTFTLSPESRRLAPNVKGSDYALSQLALGVTHSRQLRPGWGPSQLRISTGKIWASDDNLRWFQRLDLSQSFPIAPSTQIVTSAYGERQNPIRLGEPEATLWGARLSYQRELDSGATFGLSAETQFYDADIRTFEYRFNQLRATYSLGKPVWTLGLSFHAAASIKTYDVFSLSLNGRLDRKAELGMTAVFTKLTAFGFSPSLSIRAHQTWSNVDRFDTRGISMALGFNSRF